MAAQYKNISAAEMDAFLVPQGFSKITPAGVAEIVYAKRIHQGKWQMAPHEI